MKKLLFSALAVALIVAGCDEHSSPVGPYGPSSQPSFLEVTMTPEEAIISYFVIEGGWTSLSLRSTADKSLRFVLMEGYETAGHHRFYWNYSNGEQLCPSGEYQLLLSGVRLTSDILITIDY